MSVCEFFEWFANYYKGNLWHVELTLAHDLALVPCVLVGSGGTGKTLIMEGIAFTYKKEERVLVYSTLKTEADKWLYCINIKKLENEGRVDKAIEFLIDSRVKFIGIDEVLRLAPCSLQALLQLLERRTLNYGTAELKLDKVSIIGTTNPITESPDIVEPPRHLLNRFNLIPFPTQRLYFMIKWKPRRHEELIEEMEKTAPQLDREKIRKEIEDIKVSEEMEILLSSLCRVFNYCKHAYSCDRSLLGTNEGCSMCNPMYLCRFITEPISGWRIKRNAYLVAKALAYIRGKDRVTRDEVKDAILSATYYKTKINFETDAVNVFPEIQSIGFPIDQVTALQLFIDKAMTILNNTFRTLYDILTQEKAISNMLASRVELRTTLEKLKSESPILAVNTLIETALETLPLREVSEVISKLLGKIPKSDSKSSYLLGNHPYFTEEYLGSINEYITQLSELKSRKVLGKILKLAGEIKERGFSDESKMKLLTYLVTLRLISEDKYQQCKYRIREHLIKIAKEITEKDITKLVTILKSIYRDLDEEIIKEEVKSLIEDIKGVVYLSYKEKRQTQYEYRTLMDYFYGGKAR